MDLTSLRLFENFKKFQESDQPLRSIGERRLLIERAGDDVKNPVDLFTERELINTPQNFDELQTQRAEIIKEIDKVVKINLNAFGKNGCKCQPFQKFLNVKENNKKIYLIISDWDLNYFQLKKLNISVLEKLGKSQNRFNITMEKFFVRGRAKKESYEFFSTRHDPPNQRKDKRDFTEQKFLVSCLMVGNFIYLEYIKNELLFFNDYEIHLSS